VKLGRTQFGKEMIKYGSTILKGLYPLIKCTNKDCPSILLKLKIKAAEN